MVNKVDESIRNQDISNWKFDKEVSEVFDSHVRKSVPMYDEFHQLITEISDWYVQNDTNVYDIGTSTGTCIKNINTRHINKSLSYIGIDNSDDMVEKAKMNLQNNKNVSIICDDVSSSNIKIINASFITSVLTLQFMSIEKRQIVVDKIYKGLNEGCAFVMVEKVVCSNSRIDEMYMEIYHDMKLANGLNEQEILAKSRTIRGVMRPNTIEENITMLERAGFKNTDIFFKWGNFVGIIAIK